ncbi:helix-turn-helix domain-containing protein [Corallococcus sp. bb12-1]|uniref:helix-turn-helix domain-containing protein n=1 Tax=Corallococcus sp. bb12-1 TaxID=2996784 RepID=UPI003B634C5D
MYDVNLARRSHAVAALRATGRSWREIAQALHVPRRTLTRTWALEHNPGLDSAA